jgi:hypothetical protein
MAMNQELFKKRMREGHELPALTVSSINTARRNQ